MNGSFYLRENEELTYERPDVERRAFTTGTSCAYCKIYNKKYV